MATTATATATTEAKAEKPKPTTPKLVDIRDTIPLATKGGTASKPVWTIEGKTYSFIKPVNKSGLDKNGAKIQLGKRIFAKYVASKTRAGEDLLFVGVFAEKKVKEAAEKPAAAE